PVGPQRGGIGAGGVAVGDRDAGEPHDRYRIRDGIGRRPVFPLHADAVIEIIVALHHVVAGEHQLDAPRVAALGDRTVVADAFEQLLGRLLAHDGVEAGEIAVLGRIERDASLEEGIAEVGPLRRNFVFGYEAGIVGYAVLAPVPRRPAALRIDEAAIGRQQR